MKNPVGGFCPKAIGFTVVALLLASLTGCARNAPNLPVSHAGKSDEEMARLLNLSEADLKMSCPELTAAYQKLRQDTQNEEQKIESHRVRNQINGYLGALFIFPALGTENDAEAKENLDQLQQRKDQILYLQDKKCS